MKTFAKLAATTLLAVAAVATAWAWDNDIVISTPNTSMVLSCNNGQELRFSHYGPRIEADKVDALHQVGAGMNRPAYPAFGSEFNSLASLAVVHADGNPTTFLGFKNAETKQTPQGELTVITLADNHYPMEVRLNYLAHPESDVIETWAEITNNEKKPIQLKRMDSGFLPVRRGDVWAAHLHGNWGAEATPVIEPLTMGVKSIRNLDGQRNGLNERAELMLSLDGQPRENQGRTIGAVLCWSGNYELRLDTENEYCHNLMAGICTEASEYTLDPKQTFTTPRLALTYSDKGMSGVSRNIHRWARNGAVHGCEKPRDILLNSWEGVYMDVQEEKMNEMMADFAALGGELFVMDDGWFGDKYPRDTDNSSLGDWVVNKRKLPNGVEGLIKAAKNNGIKFGIWIEPENINSISELFEKHPEWVLQAPYREMRPTRGGTQLMLDMANPEVQDFVFHVVDDLMTANPELAYIKWDANTSLLNYGSTYLPKDRQLQVMIDYHKGLEAALKRIREKYPDLVIQACGSGGGRVSYGVMPYFDEMWVSDNTDALQRLRIQWGTSMFYPAIAMAQHVSASPNHQLGRRLPLKFRFDVAMSGRLGMEMQPSALNDEEKEFARQAIADYKTIRPIVQFGNIHRLISPFDNKGFSSLMYVDDDARNAVLYAYKLEHYIYQTKPRFHLEGLNPDAMYTIREINVPKGQNPCHLHGKTVPGSVLMEAGIEMPLDGEYASRVFHLTQI